MDDRIIAVNGVRDDVARMATELLSKSLTVEVCRYSERRHPPTLGRTLGRKDVVVF